MRRQYKTFNGKLPKQGLKHFACNEKPCPPAQDETELEHFLFLGPTGTFKEQRTMIEFCEGTEPYPGGNSNKTFPSYLGMSEST